MKAVFWLGIMVLMRISRLRFKQSRISMLIPHIYVLGRFGNFVVIFRCTWRSIVLRKGLVKLMEIGNFEDFGVVLKLEFEVKNRKMQKRSWSRRIITFNVLEPRINGKTQ